MIPPPTIAAISRSVGFSTPSPFSIHPEITIPEKAPMDMNPACPRLSSPEIPTTRFRETAITTQQQIGTNCPFSVREIALLLIRMVKTMNAMITTA